ncbi:MAG: hypothetical protein KC502_01090 [Myxococcales bacterium]|nr:hypothetical protein [Myxococcales bacterium]
MLSQSTVRRSIVRRSFVQRVALILVLSFGLAGCDALKMTVDKVRMKLIGITVTDPERESAEWVLMQAIEAAADKNAERGWEKFQKVLHTSERSPNALRSWYTGAWPRMRRQVSDYDINGDGSFKIVNVKEMVKSSGGTAGLEFYIVSRKKEMPTPCAVYLDENHDDKWRIRRCSL